jgi:hypothetical protein
MPATPSRSWPTRPLESALNCALTTSEGDSDTLGRTVGLRSTWEGMVHGERLAVRAMGGES